jgi:hypothetical protein
VLIQNRGSQAEIVTAIAQFRATTVGDATAPLSVATARRPTATGSWSAASSSS